MTATDTSPRLPEQLTRTGIASTIRSEWIKFRTVRGWMIALVVAAVLCVAFTFLVANGHHEAKCTPTGGCRAGHPFVPKGPDGEAVADTYQYLARPITGNATITARVTSMTGLIWNGPTNQAPSPSDTRNGLVPWAKAGILLTPSTTSGSVYAAVMATGSHGVRFQHNYTNDQPGAPGVISDTSPRWLRLTRSGDTITTFDSTDGTTWHRIGYARLARLPATVDVGLFVTSPVSFDASSSGNATQATATFDHLTLDGDSYTGAWHSHSIGTTSHNGFSNYYPTLGTGSSHRSGRGLVITGSGDIAPAVATLAGAHTASDTLTFGIVVALIVLSVIATMFVTAEYRRGLIRITFTATPQRTRVLAAKAVVIGATAFVIGTIAAAAAIPLSEHVLNANGNFVFPMKAFTLARITVGAGLMVAVIAASVLAVGVILRRSAGAVTAAIIVFVLPIALGPGLVGKGTSGSATTWLYRLTPAAGFSILGSLHRSTLVDYRYTFANGYYPLSPWAGLAVLCAWAAFALGLAAYLLQRRDA